jgi:uncharacterized protein
MSATLRPSAAPAGGRATAAGVTLVSAVRLKPGAEHAHRVLQDQAVADARRIGGLVRAELIPAIEGVQSETVALLTFADRPGLDRWLTSPQRDTALERMAGLLDGDRTLTVIGDFAGWFRSGAGHNPPRWKQALVVLAGLIPVSLAVSLVRAQLLPQLALPAAVALTAACNVVVLTWAVMPVLTRIVGRWLSA